MAQEALCVSVEGIPLLALARFRVQQGFEKRRVEILLKLRRFRGMLGCFARKTWPGSLYLRQVARSPGRRRQEEVFFPGGLERRSI